MDAEKLFAMKEWRMGWHAEVRHWPISTRKRLILKQHDHNVEEHAKLAKG